MQSALVPLELGVPEGDNIAGANFVVLLDRCVGEVSVDKSTIGAVADGGKSTGNGGEGIGDERMRG